MNNDSACSYGCCTLLINVSMENDMKVELTVAWLQSAAQPWLTQRAATSAAMAPTSPYHSARNNGIRTTTARAATQILTQVSADRRTMNTRTRLRITTGATVALVVTAKA